MKSAFLLALMVTMVPLSQGQNYNKYNWPKRRAIIANVCPDLKITSFAFGNTTEPENYTKKFSSEYAWENIGQKEIEAFELVILRYDPFNRSETGQKAIFPGHNSATYSVLKPGEKDSDGGNTFGDDDIYTAIVYIRNIRFSDGTVWSFRPEDLIKSIKTQVPDLLDVGPLVPEKPKSGSE